MKNKGVYHICLPHSDVLGGKKGCKYMDSQEVKNHYLTYNIRVECEIKYSQSPSQHQEKCGICLSYLAVMARHQRTEGDL